mmetsp:Transcript_194/g.233  ORF Transcript_194/g.233 Transcript_194/m.233 type:complete len:202 (-) Transcript_194:109-714(-)
MLREFEKGRNDQSFRLKLQGSVLSGSRFRTHSESDIAQRLQEALDINALLNDDVELQELDHDDYLAARQFLASGKEIPKVKKKSTTMRQYKPRDDKEVKIVSLHQEKNESRHEKRKEAKEMSKPMNFRDHKAVLDQELPVQKSSNDDQSLETPRRCCHFIVSTLAKCSTSKPRDCDVTEISIEDNDGNTSEQPTEVTAKSA